MRNHFTKHRIQQRLRSAGLVSSCADVKIITYFLLFSLRVAPEKWIHRYGSRLH